MLLIHSSIWLLVKFICWWKLYDNMICIHIVLIWLMFGWILMCFHSMHFIVHVWILVCLCLNELISSVGCMWYNCMQLSLPKLVIVSDSEWFVSCVSHILSFIVVKMKFFLIWTLVIWNDHIPFLLKISFYSKFVNSASCRWGGSPYLSYFLQIAVW